MCWPRFNLIKKTLFSSPCVAVLIFTQTSSVSIISVTLPSLLSHELFKLQLYETFGLGILTGGKSRNLSIVPTQRSEWCFQTRHKCFTSAFAFTTVSLQASTGMYTYHISYKILLNRDHGDCTWFYLGSGLAMPIYRSCQWYLFERLDSAQM